MQAWDWHVSRSTSALVTHMLFNERQQHRSDIIIWSSSSPWITINQTRLFMSLIMHSDDQDTMLSCHVQHGHIDALQSMITCMTCIPTVQHVIPTWHPWSWHIIDRWMDVVRLVSHLLYHDARDLTWIIGVDRKWCDNDGRSSWCHCMHDCQPVITWHVNDWQCVRMMIWSSWMTMNLYLINPSPSHPFHFVDI